MRGSGLKSRQKSEQSSARAYHCGSYELRLTRRCQQEDLDYYGEEPFHDLAGHEIVRALIKRRSDGPSDTREVSPLSCGKPVYRLSYGNRHRGATWYDEVHGVVWLLAYGQHEFEGQGDVFPYFKDLDAEGQLLPGPADYEALFRDRDTDFVREIGAEAKVLLAGARSTPGWEVVATLASAVEVSVVVTVVESLEERHVAITMSEEMATEHFLLVLAALFPEKELGEIESADRMPGRSLTPHELAFKALVG